MKKNIRCILLIVLMLILIFSVTYVYAFNKEVIEIDDNNFFEVSNSEITKNEKVEMTVRFDKIEYSKFLFELKSTENMKNLEILDSENNLDVEQDSNQISFEINKENTNLTSITLYYQISEDAQINDVIKFIATVTDLGDNENEDMEFKTQTIEAEVKIIEEENESTETSDEIQKPSIDIEDVDNKETAQSPNKEQNQTNINNNQLQEVEQINTQKIANNSSYNIQQTSNTITSNNKSEQETVVYNGSDNNYLSELSINGYTLNKEFSKDNSTYFVTVENDVNLLDIIATAENSSGIVCIYGNENLSEGTNKVLISVTAENGNVRNYRIYVTKNA